MASRMGWGRSRTVTVRPTFDRVMRPASSSTSRCFITAGSVTRTRPDYSDIPSQLFSGADVYKSSTGNLLVDDEAASLLGNG